MTKRYETGSRKLVIKLMVQYAIRDQRELIDAMIPSFGKPDSINQEAIDDCRKLIRDFKRLEKTLLGG